MKPFMEIPETVILRKAGAAIHDYVGALADGAPFDAKACMERALESIRAYYRKLHGIGYLNRPMDWQIAELGDAMAHYGPIVQGLVDKARMRYDKKVKVRQISEAYTRALILPAFVDAGYDASVSILGTSAVIQFSLASDKMVRLSISNPASLNAGSVGELVLSLRELEDCISRMGCDVRIV